MSVDPATLAGQISDIRYQLSQLSASLGAYDFDQAGDVIRRLVIAVKNIQTALSQLQQTVSGIQVQQASDEAALTALTSRVAALEAWAATVTPPFVKGV